MSRDDDAPGIVVAASLLGQAVREWPSLDERGRAAAFAAAIDAVEAVEWAPIESQHQLLAAKQALSGGIADGLSEAERRAALSEAARRLEGLAPAGSGRRRGLLEGGLGDVAAVVRRSGEGVDDQPE